MKKLKWNRKLSILVLIMFVTVSFASFNTNLFIDGKAYVRVDKDIRITNIRLLESEYNGYENTSSEYTNRTISTDVSLPRQASSVTYEVTISNVSDRRYKITDIIEDSYDNKDVKYELIDASIGNIVEPHTEKTFKVKFTNNVTVVEEDDVYETKTYNFGYTGDIQEFIAPYNGIYKIELWGASGGDNDRTTMVSGGLGGYVSGEISLLKNKKIYVYVGGKGENANADYRPNGGWNGGGKSNDDYTQCGGGGGATDVRLLSGEWNNFNSLKSRIMVAGGGGGVAYPGSETEGWEGSGGAGGGLQGLASSDVGEFASPTKGTGATQISEGHCSSKSNLIYGYGKFGIGGNGLIKTSSKSQSAGGGGGYYGGGGSCHCSPGGGGSSYISGHDGCNSVSSDSTSSNIVHTNQSSHFSNYVFSNTKVIDGEGYSWTNVRSDTPEGMPSHDGNSTMTGNQGNGYAKITLTRKINDGSEYDFDYTGGEQTFTAPYTGVYQLETWGAQGGNISCENNNGYVCMDNASKSYKGGYGGYSRGTLNLSKDDSLYINIGGQGKFNADYGTNGVSGGYNGGGDSYGWLSKALTTGSRMVSSGGGATHIALVSGLLNSLENQKDKIIMVSGGGAGAWYFSNPYRTINVGNAGGFIGGSGEDRNGVVSGGTQTGPGNLGGTLSTFGQGAGLITAEQCGGGGGYYGGNSSTYAGGGGSGYIGNDILKEKIMYCYDCEESKDTNTKTVSTQSHSKMPKQNVAKEGNGYSRITLIKRTVNQTKLTLDFTFEEYVNGNEFTFGYTGEPQEFVVPKTGYYKVELWGASGDNYKNDYIQEHKSFAAYTSGKIKLNKGEHLYVYVGGQSKRFNSSKDSIGGISGGATDIRLKETENWYDLDSLSSRIMVAAGSGQTYNDQHANPSADAGGLTSYGIPSGGNWEVNITTQTAGGIGSHARSSTLYTYDGGNGEFGIGGTAANQITAEGAISGSAYNSGAGGYYGGGGGPSGGSGSSFISGHNGCVAIVAESDTTPRNDSNGNQCADGTTDITCSKHYSNYIFTDTKMIDGKGYEWTTEVGTEVVGMPTHDGTSTMTGNDGDGFAKITCLEEVTDYSFDYTGDVQEFVAPYNGIYKVELWGADGSNIENETNYGGYTSGKIQLNKNKKLYVYVGSEGNIATEGNESQQYTDFNGGGRSYQDGGNNTKRRYGTGGGATDIRLVNGNWDSFDSLKSRIMVAGAGGGTYSGVPNSSEYIIRSGGAGGGLYGHDGDGNHYYGRYGSGGSQFEGGFTLCDETTICEQGWSGLVVNQHYGIGGFGKSGISPVRVSCGGGSGYFGGGSSLHTQGAGGGSSYISGHPGCASITESSTSDNITFVNDSNGVACNDENSTGYNASGYNTDSACSKHYSGKVFTDTIMIDGKGYAWDENGVGNTIVGMPSHDGRSTMIGNTGNGYAKITLLEKIDTYSINYNLDGGTLNNPRKTYSTFDDDLLLSNPTKPGYTFTGWTNGKNYARNIGYHLNGTETTQEFSDGVEKVNPYSNYNSGVWFDITTNYRNIIEDKPVVVSMDLKADENKKIRLCIDNTGGTCKVVDVTTEWQRFYVYRPQLDLAIRRNFTIYNNDGKTPGNSVSYYIRNVQIEVGNEMTEYEPYISTPTIDLTIPKGSTGNRYYKANWSQNVATLESGGTVNVRMKSLAGMENASYDSNDSSVTKIVYNTQIPESVKNAGNVISITTSEFPVYIDYNDGILTWYTEASKIKLTSGYKIFSRFNNVTEIEVLPYLDTSAVEDMNGMFEYCYELKEVDLSHFNTSNVKTLHALFHCCKNIKNLDLSSFDTSQVTEMGLLLSMWDDSKGERAKDSLLTSITFGSGWNTSNVKSFNTAFYGLISLEELDLSMFDTSSVENTYHMFTSSRALKTIYVSDKFDLSSATSTKEMFNSTVSLVGGAGTTYNNSKTDGEYARIDNPPDSPGYFTLKQ